MSCTTVTINQAMRDQIDICEHGEVAAKLKSAPVYTTYTCPNCGRLVTKLHR